MSKHSFTDKDGDEFSAEVDPDIPSLLDIKMNDSEDNWLCIRVDAAEEFANIILAAVREAKTNAEGA